MTDYPPKLRGDLSKWLCEINTGVYVGQLSGRVRDAVWERVCKHLKTGRATMVFTTNNEQRMDFRVHNTVWEPVDFDGIKLMRRPLSQSAVDETLKPGFSNVAKRRMAQHAREGGGKRAERYVVIDVETTGLNAGTAHVIEYGAIRVENDLPGERFSVTVKQPNPLPAQIVSLTGLTDELLAEQGQAPREALEAFLRFIGRDRLVGYHVQFDLEFIQAECRRNGCQMPANRSVDILSLARRKISNVENYKLATLAAWLQLPGEQQHRAIPDCEMALSVYQKLK